VCINIIKSILSVLVLDSTLVISLIGLQIKSLRGQQESLSAYIVDKWIVDEITRECTSSTFAEILSELLSSSPPSLSLPR